MSEYKNLIYRMVFSSRIERGEPPYYYIGSKNNATVNDGKVYGKCSTLYNGSSKYKNWKNICKDEEWLIEVLASDLDPSTLLEAEKEFQLEVSAKTNPEYFNLEYASTNTFTMAGYGTYKHHAMYDKCVRLPIDDPLVLDGTFVGATKGYPMSEENKKRHKARFTGSTHPLYGKKHSDETIRKISEANKISGLGRKHKPESIEKMRKAHKGVPRSEEHCRKLSGLVMLIHPEGKGNAFKCPTELLDHMKALGFVTTFTYAQKNSKMATCQHCGKEGQRLSPGMLRWHFDKCRSKK